MKGKVKRIVSGLLSAMTILTTVAQPLTAYAAEPEPTAFEAQYPALDVVRDMLSEGEIVTASDYEVAVGSTFDVKNDFSGLEVQTDKVEIALHEAKNGSGEVFDVNRADVYRAVYMVEPRSEHPAYHVVRNITVKEPVTEAQTEIVSEGSTHGGQEEGDSEEDAESDSQEPSNSEPVTEQPEETEVVETPIKSEEELDAALQAAQEQEIVDRETGLSFGEVMMQATEQGVDFTELEPGESLTFTAQSKKLRAARASQSVTVTQGEWYYYADYGLGTYLTSPFTVTFGNVTATAYCIEPSKPDREVGLIRSQNWKETGNWQRFVITERKLPVLLRFLQNIIRIFPQGNGLSLPIWLHPMPMEAVMRFMGQIVPVRVWQWSFTIMQ